MSDIVITEEEKQEYINSLSLMDDILMSLVFKEIKPTQLLVRIILNKPDLIVKSTVTQHSLKNLKGHAVTLDIYAEDKNGKQYDIEFQNLSSGADLHRARYNAAMVDLSSLKSGNNYQDLRETYIIFITEDDYFKRGLPLYNIEPFIVETMEKTPNGIHYIYVNGQNKSDTNLGRLIKDLHCTNPEDMWYHELKEPVIEYKFSKEEQKYMSTFQERLEEVKNMGIEQGIEQGKDSVILQFIKSNAMPKEDIAKITNIPLEEIERIAKQA